jgi:hypothetical protein
MRRLLSLTFAPDQVGLRHWSLLWESNGIGRPVDGATYCVSSITCSQLQLHNPLSSRDFGVQNDPDRVIDGRVLLEAPVTGS